MNAASSTEHEPSQATEAASTTLPNIDQITRHLQTRRVKVADRFFHAWSDRIDLSSYFLAVNSCVYDLFEDHRGSNDAKAWITS